MAIQKQGITMNFAQGLDLKTDPNQVQFGKFLALENAVFQNGGGLQKRNGFGAISTLPNTLQTTLTTHNGNLVATGSNLYSYTQSNDTWSNRGSVQPIGVSTLPIIRTSDSQIGCDSAIDAHGNTCTVWTESGGAYYNILNAANSIVVARTALPATASNPRAFLLGAYFVITFKATVSGSPHLQRIAIPTSVPTSPGTATDVSTSLRNITTSGYDGLVVNNSLYLIWEASGTDVKLCYVSSTLSTSSAKTIATSACTLAAVSASINTIWFHFFDGTDGWSAVYDLSLNVVAAKTKTINAITINQLTAVTTDSTCTLLFSVINSYSWSGRTDFCQSVACSVSGSTITAGAATTVKRGVGLASKAFTVESTNYALVYYQGTLQPSYFLMDFSGNILARLAYSNGQGVTPSMVLTTLSVSGSSVTGSYVLNDLIVPLSKTDTGSSGGISSQTGLNLVTFNINDSSQLSNEIAGSLHLTGGQLWQYDGTTPVEHGFQVWPENVSVSTATGAGSIAAGTYYYVACYEWTDNAGNLHRSAPSIAVSQVTTTASSTNTIKVPTLRLTAKSNVRIVLYRYSVAQPVYYQVTTIAAPPSNTSGTSGSWAGGTWTTGADSVTITDTQADSTILGRTILYTTGGVVENIAAPANVASCLHKSRLFVVDAEDRNLVWYSKQVLSGTPVEMSDLLTVYVAPTTGAQGSTGPVTALASMDDKLILFKSNAIYYMSGTGPDATGANNDFGEPTFITSVAGCSAPRSIVFMPAGLMFQSDKGVWLLGRDLSTKYVGAAVEAYNGTTVNSAQNIPGTNQVRFTLDSGVTLMYDYYYDQWGTFSSGAGGVSSTLWQSKHTLLNVLGQVRQEGDAYLDGTKPVLLSFTTSWIKLAGLMGFQRAYYLTLLSNYLTPHRLTIGLAYDYQNITAQTTIISPDNYNGMYGDDSLYGGSSPYGGPSNLEQWRIFFNQQKCQSIQLTVTETFDASKGVVAGAGLTVSGINFVIGGKLPYNKLAAKNSAS